MKLKNVILVLLATIGTARTAAASQTLPEILGAWTKTGRVVQGQIIGLADAREHTVAFFTEPGLSYQFSWRDDLPGFCERRGVWFYDAPKQRLVQWIVAVNPTSRPDCLQDPEWQAGRRVYQDLKITPGELRLSVTLGEDEQTLWTRLEEKY